MVNELFDYTLKIGADTSSIAQELDKVLSKAQKNSKIELNIDTQKILDQIVSAMKKINSQIKNNKSVKMMDLIDLGNLTTQLKTGNSLIDDFKNHAAQLFNDFSRTNLKFLDINQINALNQLSHDLASNMSSFGNVAKQQSSGFSETEKSIKSLNKQLEEEQKRLNDINAAIKQAKEIRVNAEKKYNLKNPDAQNAEIERALNEYFGDLSDPHAQQLLGYTKYAKQEDLKQIIGDDDGKKTSALEVRQQFKEEIKSYRSGKYEGEGQKELKSYAKGLSDLDSELSGRNIKNLQEEKKQIQANIDLIKEKIKVANQSDDPKPKKDTSDKSDLAIPNKESTSTANQEVELMNRLNEAIQNVKVSVGQKTEAFQNEVNTVRTVVQEEIQLVDTLSDKLKELRNSGVHKPENASDPSLDSNTDNTEKLEYEVQSVVSKSDLINTAIDEMTQSVQNGLPEQIQWFKELQNQVDALRGSVDALVLSLNQIKQNDSLIKQAKLNKNAVPTDTYNQNAETWLSKQTQNLQDKYSTVSNASISQANNGVVTFSANVQDAENKWHKLVSTIDSSGNIIRTRFQDIRDPVSQKNAKDIDDVSQKMNEYVKSISEAEKKIISLQVQNIKKSSDTDLVSKNQALIAVEQERIEKIKQENSEYLNQQIILEKISAEQKEAYLSNAESNIADNIAVQQSKLAETISKQQESLQNKLLSPIKSQTYISNISSFEQQENKIRSFYTYLDQLKQKYQELKSLVSTTNVLDAGEFEQASIKAKNLKKDIESLSNTLKSSKFNTDSTFIESTPYDLGNARVEMEQYLATLSNVDAHSIKWSNDNQQVTYTIKEQDGALTKMKMTYDNISGSINQVAVSSQKAMSGMQKFGTELTNKFKDVAKYFLSFVSVFEIINIFKQGLGVIKSLDTAMVEVRKVTDETEASYNKFKETISGVAREVASTNASLMSSSADWARLGEDFKNIDELAKNAAMFVNVGDGIDINTATSDMITAMKAFDIQAENSISIVDKYNEVGNNFAISSAGIGESLKRSSSALAVGNNTFDESIAMATAMNEIVQNTEQVGNALKVFSLRLRGAKTELVDMGEDTEGMAETTSKLQEQIQALTNIDGTGGFNILTDTGAFKSTYDIVKGIGSVFEDMDDMDQAALLELIAGKQRANSVAALLKNWQQLDKILATSQNSEGSALKENEAVVNSIEGKLRQLSATGEEFWSDLLDSNFIKGSIDVVNALVSALDNLLKTLSTPVTIGLFTGLIAGIKNMGGTNYTVVLMILPILI